MGTSNRHKATLTLAVVTAGFFMTYPFSHTFAGGLAASGFSAAMIGGLADWFAVTALFRKPLGIPFRTAVIPRGRERIIEAIIAAIERELLTKENIKETLGHYDIAGLMIRYLVDYGGKERIKDILRRVGDDIVAQQDPERIGRFAAELIAAGAGRMRLAPQAGQILEWSVRQGLADKLVEFFLAEAAHLLHQPQAKGLLVRMLAEARQVYEKGLTRRRFVLQFLEGMGLSADAAAELVRLEAAAFADRLSQPEHLWRKGLREKALQTADGLMNNAIIQERFENRKNAWLAEYPNLAGLFGEIAGLLKQALAGDRARFFAHSWVGSKVDGLVAGFGEDACRREVFAGMLREALTAVIDAHHFRIGQIVRERLARYKTDEFVAFIEARVGNDLQMIRINGSVVGGLAGMAIFLLTYWW